MFIIQGKIVSSDLFSRRFVCNLSKCQGACCWEGDYGAPVADDEIKTIEDILDQITPLLNEESADIIQRDGVAPWSELYKGNVTPLLSDGSCAFLIRENGIARCAFEKAFEGGLTTFKKPVSCHLYPVRISENTSNKMESLNYDEWDICSSACSLGEEMQVPVFRFVKSALTRKYGQSFYDQMEDIYETYFV